MSIFKQNDFKIYDVYSMGYNTSSAMASLFHISTNFLPKQNGTTTAKDAEFANDPGFFPGLHSGFLRSALNGNNIVNTLLQEKGYSTVLSLQGSYDMQAFRGTKYYDSIFTGSVNKYENKARNQVLKNILKGTLNSDLANDSISSYLFNMAKFVQSQSGRNKYFVWGTGCPWHSTLGLGSTEKELQRFFPIYNECLEAMREEIEMLKESKNAIIIFMSDHGSFFVDNGYRFTKNYDFNKTDYMKFRDIFGAFMAVHWPNMEKAEKYDSDFNVSQDLFPIIFAYLFDSEIPLKYKIKKTELRLGPHKFDKGAFYPYFYSEDSK
jgi:membrane-anchored protein YejM (alkaline phosphatase superfamily)